MTNAPLVTSATARAVAYFRGFALMMATPARLIHAPTATAFISKYPDAHALTTLTAMTAAPALMIYA